MVVQKGATIETFEKSWSNAIRAFREKRRTYDDKSDAEKEKDKIKIMAQIQIKKDSLVEVETVKNSGENVVQINETIEEPIANEVLGQSESGNNL